MQLQGPYGTMLVARLGGKKGLLVSILIELMEMLPIAGYCFQLVDIGRCRIGWQQE